MPRRFYVVVAVLLLMGGAAARAGEPPKPAPVIAPPKPVPVIALSQSTEEGKKQIVATVTLAGKPLENAAVSFRIRRTFGDLSVGKDQTLDDGTAAVPFPADLPGDKQGQLLVMADVQAGAKWADGHAEQVFAGAAAPPDRAFPRALWAPHGPIVLILVIFSLFAGVWLSYLYVAVQIWKIRKGASREHV